MIKTQNYLVILFYFVLFFKSLILVNLILFKIFGTAYHHQIKRFLRRNRHLHPPPTFLSSRHLQILSCILSTSKSKTYTFIFSGSDASHATPQVCGAPILRAVSHDVRIYS